MRQKLIKLCLVCAMTLSLVNLSFVEGVKALSGYDNIALNKTVSAASTHSSKNISYANDGKVVDKQTWQVDYSTGSDYNRGKGNLEQYFIVDLGGNALINQIDLTWTETVWAKYVKVEGSFDGVNYFLIKEVSDNVITSDKEKQIIEFDLTKTKYVKLTFNEPNNQTYGYEFYEIEVYGTELENLALNKTVTADSTASGKSVNYLVDGAVVDKQTWQVAYVAGSAYDRGDGNTEVQLNLDLDARCIINEIDLTWATTVWAKTIKIEGSVDGNEYFLIKEITDNVISADKERQIIAIEDKEVQYLRFTFNDPNNKTYGYELYEIEVYGAELVNDKVDLEALYEEIKVIPPTISADNTLVLPATGYEDYKVVIYGSSNESVISTDGTIYTPLEDKVVNISYKIVNVNDESDCYFNDYDEVAITIPGLYNKEEVDNEKPKVLPEISEWKGITGNFTLADDAKLVIADESLRETVELVQYYFNEMLDREIEVVVGSPNPGDIYFELGDKKELGKEGYMAMIDDQVNVLAYDKKGLQYAGATLVQILSQDENHVSLPKGLIRDYPAFAVRSMMIDVGRYYIPLDYMTEIAKYMSYFKMSEFHVHLNDNGGEQSYGFRLQSEKYPQINSNLNPDHVYSKEAYKAFQKEVMRFGIDVITEIDTPAHSGFLNLYDKSFLLNDRHIDLSNPEVISFIKSLFDEYLDGEDPVIQSSNFHIGVDEYPVAHSDLARQYCDELIKYVNAKGYNTRMWGAFGSSSGLAGSYEVTTDVICNYWSPNYSDPKQMIQDGYAAINNNRTYLYEVPSSDVDRNKFSVKQGWDNWNVIDVPGVTLSNSTPMLHGAESAFWYDNEAGYSEFDSWEVLKGMALLIAEKAWVGKDDVKTAKEFEETIELLADYAPGANPSRYVPTQTEEIVLYDFEDVEENVVKDATNNQYDATLNGLTVETKDGNNVLALNGEGYMSLPFAAKGLNYSVGFNLTLDEAPTENAVLFNGEYADGTFYLNYEGKGETAFVRKDYLFKFDFEFEKGKTYDVILTCDTNDTTLYVNGVLVSKAVAQVNAARKTTFALPTEEIGSGVVGTLDNFALLNKALSYDEILGFEENAVDNLALNKPTSVSGLETDDGRFTSDLAVDGDTATRVSFEKKDDAWFIVDLEDTYWVESIEIEFGELPTGFQLYVSEDANEWTMVHEDSACAGGTALTFSKPFATGIKARYVKYQQLGMFTASNGRNYSGNFNEFRVWGAKESVIQNALQQAKDILANTEVNETNEAYLAQLANSVTFIETSLTTSEELKLACNQLQKEIEKFNEGTYAATSANKTKLNDLLANRKEDVSAKNLYDFYLKQALEVYVDSDASQAEVDELVNELSVIVYTTNLALNGEIISYNGLNPGRINDGQKPARGNYWDSDGDAQNSSIVVKLTQPSSLDSIVVIPYFYRSDYYYNYEVLVSADNENWTSVATYTDKTGKYSEHGQTFEVATDMVVEYIKIQGIESNNSNKIHITELEAYAVVYPDVNKDALQAAIVDAEAYDATLLPEDLLAVFNNAFAKAQAVYRDAAALQNEVDETTQNLIDAMVTVEAKFEVVNFKVEAVDYKTIQLSWDATKDATGYVVERLTAEGDWIDLATITEPTYVVSGVKTGKVYTYRVKAVSADKVSEYVETTAQTTLTGEIELTLTNNGTNKFDLAWNEVAGATRYIVYRKTNDGEWKKIITLGKDARSYTSKAMLEGTYSYIVKAARYDSGERVYGPTTNEVSGVATNEAITLEVTTQDGVATLTWNEIESMSGYEVFRATSMDGKYSLLKRVKNNQVETTLNKAYFFKVRAVRYVNNEKVYTQFSNVVTAQ